MREKIKNTLLVTCNDIDFTKITNIEFYITQSEFFRQYTPSVMSAHEMIVTIPFEDANQMKRGNAELQFAFVDENGFPDASVPKTVAVNKLLKEVGYDPI